MWTDYDKALEITSEDISKLIGAVNKIIGDELEDRSKEEIAFISGYCFASSCIKTDIMKKDIQKKEISDILDAVSKAGYKGAKCGTIESKGDSSKATIICTDGILVVNKENGKITIVSKDEPK